MSAYEEIHVLNVDIFRPTAKGRSQMSGNDPEGARGARGGRRGCTKFRIFIKTVTVSSEEITRGNDSRTVRTGGTGGTGGTGSSRILIKSMV